MSRFHVYISPFATDSGEGYADEIEVSDDIDWSSLGSIVHALDNTDYDIGVFRNSSFRFRLSNDAGLYSEPGTSESIFKYRRGDSLVRITWEPGERAPVCGFFLADGLTPLSEEVEIFKGLLNDDTAESDIDDQIVTFTALGFESLFARTEIGSAGDTLYDSINPGDLLSSIVYKLVNQAPFNELVEVSLANIALGQNAAIDDKSELENSTVLEALGTILLATNSVLYVRDGVLIVSPRAPGEDLAYTFYGQASRRGVENIAQISSLRNGENRVFNYFTWKDTTILRKDDSSVDRYGVFKKEISLDLITDTAKRELLLDSLLSEFGSPQSEFDLVTPIEPDRLVLFLLDKVSVDYPTLSLPTDETTAIYNVTDYNESRYARNIFALTIEANDRFKILERRINIREESIQFRMRKI